MRRTLIHDIAATRALIAARQVLSADVMRESVAAARSEVNAKSYTAPLSVDVALATAHQVDVLYAAGAPLPPLAGLAISIKDLFDVAGAVTEAGSRAMALSGAAPAAADCAAVARLRRAGAALLGRTNMTEFAYSGVGINPHFGTPANPVTAVLDPTPRIPGGSTAGGGVTVATGAAFAALGSDTGGSIRIPAALQGLVGFKCTARRTPTSGAVPLSTTLDTVCAITRTVRDAVTLHEVLADRTVPASSRPLSSYRFGVPTTLVLDGVDATVKNAFERTLATLRAAGARVEEIALSPLSELPKTNISRGFSASEAWAWHRPLITVHGAAYDPRVSARIRLGETVTAAEYIDLLAARKAWICRMEEGMAGYDAMLSPTVPIVAPAIAPLLASDDAFFAMNGLLLRNTGLVNVLDGCALSLPCNAAGEMPVGLHVWSVAMADDRVLAAGLAIEAALALTAQS